MELAELKKELDTEKGKRLKRWQARRIVEFMRDHPRVSIAEISQVLGPTPASLHGIRVTYGPRVGLKMRGGDRPVPPERDQELLQKILGQICAEVERKKEALLRAMRRGKTISLKLEVTPPQPARTTLSVP